MRISWMVMSTPTTPPYWRLHNSISNSVSLTWINNSGLGHSVTFTAVSGAPAGIPVPAVGTNARSFPTVGEFSYHCTVHVSMTGRVIVLP
jgi:plastocyanin